ncbi:Hypothetical protein PENO1_038170 [Penicillium occitanis (nom. inval.)]|nr:Hypothetical protein PENO1_038170 [Penicillium occitanis (nom. inval.)]PCH03241.1 hypothetical protein PENOC_039350 [Penicillium occitanis (nom. inval.)]
MAVRTNYLTVLAVLGLIPIVQVQGANCSSTVVISSQSDANDISSCNTIDGDVQIAENYANSLALTGITHITGSLVVNGTTNITSFTAPDLIIIEKNLELISCILLTDLNMTELTLVGDMNLEALPNLQRLYFDSGVRAAGGISITNTGLVKLDGLEITSASNGINITANTALTDISFNSLTNTSSLFIQANSNKLAVNLPNLVAVQNLTVTNTTSLSIPSLYHLTGQLQIFSSWINNFSTGPLQAGTDIVFMDNALLSNISMPDLTSLSGDLIITGNSVLKEINGFSSLANVQGIIDVTGNYTEFTLPALQDVKGGFTATSQSDFDGCDIFNELRKNNSIHGSYICSTPGGSATSSGSISTAGSTSISSIPPEITSTQPSGGGTPSLSTGAKAAIGVCIPVAVIVISALLFFWRRRRRRANEELPRSNDGQVHGEFTFKPELEGSPVTTRPSQKPELDARDNEVGRSSTMVPIELHNTPETSIH